MILGGGTAKHMDSRPNQHKRIVFFLDFADSLENADRVGSIARIIRYFNALSDSSLEVRVVSPDIKNYSSLFTQGGKHHPLPPFARINRHLAFLIFSPFIFGGILRESNLYWAKFSSSVPAILAKKLFKRPLVNYFDYNWVELSGASKESKFEFYIKSVIERLMIKNSDYFITTTETLKLDLIAKGFKYPDKIFVIPNYVDTDIFFPETGTKDQISLRILGVGRLNEQKNFPLLIDGVARLQSLISRNVEVTIVGSGPLKDELLEQAKKVRINFEIIERISNNEMPSVYKKHHIFVMTSPREGHPRALIEAMACGLPVVGTNVIGIRDVVSDGINGLLCSQTPEGVADTLLRLTNDPSLAEKLGMHAREEVVNRYSFKVLVQKERKLYEGIIS